MKTESFSTKKNVLIVNNFHWFPQYYTQDNTYLVISIIRDDDTYDSAN